MNRTTKTTRTKCLAATTCSHTGCLILLCLTLCLCCCQDKRPAHGDSGAYARRTAEELWSADSALAVAIETNRDVKYYLRTHTVLDNGFDIVATFENAHRRRLDSLLKRVEVLERVTEFQAIDLEQSTGSTWWTQRRTAGHEGIDAGDKGHEDGNEGEYRGERNVAGQPSGYGIFRSCDGSYYEGEWLAGMRYGVGLQVTPGKRLQLGEWKEDRYLGERITYTPDRTYGIDISRYQHEQERMVTKRVRGRRGRYVTRKVKHVVHYNIDWSALRITSLGTYSKKKIAGEVDYPVSFIYIKSTEGTTVRNAYFASDYVNSKRHGYKTGAYHFFSIRTTGKAQGLYFLQNSRYEEGDLPPVLDIEPTDAQIRELGGVRFLFANVRSWLSVVEKRLGVKPVLYVSHRFVNKYLVQAPDLLENYEVWIARYGEFRPDVNLASWQLCQDGRVRGIHGPVDISVMF